MFYGFGRFFIEGLRGDSLYLGTFRVSQIVSICIFFIGVGLIVYSFIKKGQKSINEQKQKT